MGWWFLECFKFALFSIRGLLILIPNLQIHILGVELKRMPKVNPAGNRALELNSVFEKTLSTSMFFGQ